ncbi:MAG: aminopeptidase family protein P, partial [Alphaproteobacteria bacterium]
AAVLSAPDSIAWLLNLRGGDLPHTPVPLSFALPHAGETGRVDWFVDGRKLVPGLEDRLGNDVTVRELDALGPALDALGSAGRQVLVDAAGSASWLHERLLAAGAGVIAGADPCALAKACKNDTELAGARAAHRRDGAALCRFLAWLARAAPKGALTEIAAADRLRDLRREDPQFRDLSFPTISGAGPDGAIVHYRATAESDRRLEPGMLYLVDSGAQYPDGTTDVTRTVFIGAAGGPGTEEVTAFTAVLRGHIALARLRFPDGTSGGQIDALARVPLWEAGLDFDHGTGHGVGSYLGVHEGPQRIAKRGGEAALRPGMIVSNEPGYYKPGAFGIRIENLLAVRTEKNPAGADGLAMLAFETLTLAPIDRAPIDPARMTPAEIAWLDAYHARVLAEIGPLVDADTANWLAEACVPL